MLEEVQGAVRPNSQVLEEAVSSTKQLTVVVVVMEPSGMCYLIIDSFSSFLKSS